MPPTVSMAHLNAFVWSLCSCSSTFTMMSLCFFWRLAGSESMSPMTTSGSLFSPKMDTLFLMNFCRAPSQQMMKSALPIRYRG